MNIKKDMKENVRFWYVSTYPTDELGKTIDKNITFDDIYNRMRNGENIYRIVNVSDSIIRERIFNKLADIYKLTYDYLYEIWMATE